MFIESQIRTLARTLYWQKLYNQSKNGSGIYLFENNTKFSGIQTLFLYWLEVYHILYKELAEMEWENLDEKVLKDDIRTDAFLYWRNKQQEKELFQIRKEERLSKNKKIKDKSNVKHYPIFKGAVKDK